MLRSDRWAWSSQRQRCAAGPGSVRGPDPQRLPNEFCAPREVGKRYQPKIFAGAPAQLHEAPAASRFAVEASSETRPRGDGGFSEASSHTAVDWRRRRIAIGSVGGAAAARSPIPIPT